MNPEICRKCACNLFYQYVWKRVCPSPYCIDNIKSMEHPYERFYCSADKKIMMNLL